MSTTREPRVDPNRPVDPAIVELRRETNPVRQALRILGPGLVTGASDDDPSGIGTYAQAGAQHGYATLWTTVLMLPLMVSIQYICAKIGLVTGRGLAGALREHYPRRVTYPAVFAMVVANTLNAGADIGAIAAAINLLVPIPAIVFVVPVSVGILLIQVFGSYRLVERVFKWLALALLAYIASALFAHPQVFDVLRGTLIPTIRLDPAYIGILVALLGTTISPYLFFWQASQEVEEQASMGRRQLWQRQGATRVELKYALADTIAGMAFSEVVAYFIILSTGATLFVAGKTTIGSATEHCPVARGEHDQDQDRRREEAVDHCAHDQGRDRVDPQEVDHHPDQGRSDDHGIELRGATGLLVETRSPGERLGQSIGSRPGQDRNRQDAGADQPDREEQAGGLTRDRPEGLRTWASTRTAGSWPAWAGSPRS